MKHFIKTQIDAIGFYISDISDNTISYIAMVDDKIVKKGNNVSYRLNNNVFIFDEMFFLEINVFKEIQNRYNKYKNEEK